MSTDTNPYPHTYTYTHAGGTHISCLVYCVTPEGFVGRWRIYSDTYTNLQRLIQSIFQGSFLANTQGQSKILRQIYSTYLAYPCLNYWKIIDYKCCNYEYFPNKYYLYPIKNFLYLVKVHFSRNLSSNKLKFNSLIAFKQGQRVGYVKNSRELAKILGLKSRYIENQIDNYMSENFWYVDKYVNK